MAKRQVITIGADGSLNSEMFGFDGKGCFAAAAEIEKEIAGLGLEMTIDGITQKDNAPVNVVVDKKLVKA